MKCGGPLKQIFSEKTSLYQAYIVILDFAVWSSRVRPGYVDVVHAADVVELAVDFEAGWLPAEPVLGRAPHGLRGRAAVHGVTVTRCDMEGVFCGRLEISPQVGWIVSNRMINDELKKWQSNKKSVTVYSKYNLPPRLWSFE